MLARNKKRSNRRPDTLMQDRQPPDRKTSCDTPPDHTLRSFRSSGTEIQFHWSQRQSSRKCLLLRKLEGFWPWRLHGGRTFAPLGETHKSHCMNARTVIVAGRQPTSRSGAGSCAPRNRHRKINHSLSIFLDFRSYIVFWPSGACPRGLRGSSEVTYPDRRRHNVRRHGCAVSWEHTGGTTFSECKPAFQSFAT